MNYKRNAQYFVQKSPVLPIILIIAGIILLFCGFLAIPLLIVGIIIGAIGGFLLYRCKRSIVSDKEIDNEINAEVANTLRMIPEKLGIDIEQVNVIDPIQIKQNYYKRIRSECKVKIGKDRKIRSSNYEVVVILFSETEIYCFERQFSLISEEQHIETIEYHYSDIVSLETKTLNTRNKDDPYIQENVDGESFKIMTSGGSFFTASRVFTNMKNPDNIKELKTFEESVQGMKQLWREKKIFS